MQSIEFNEKIIPLSSKLLRFACSFLDNKEDARDVVQDVLLKLWNNRDSLAKIENKESYSMRMIRNKCLDVLKSSRVMKLKPASGNRSDFQEFADYDAYEWKDTTRMVMDLAGKLPEIQKSVIFLRDMEQMDFTEISAITGLNVNAVRVNLSRARKQVREELLKIWENEMSPDTSGRIPCVSSNMPCNCNDLNT
jgi:RNA polymerase sigma factor (sigma-70 family)